MSRALRHVRKQAARATGLHGFISGKGYLTDNYQTFDIKKSAIQGKDTSTITSIDEILGIHDVNALEAERLARCLVTRQRRRGRAHGNSKSRLRWGSRKSQQHRLYDSIFISDCGVVPTLDSSPDAQKHRRRQRVEEIDRLLLRGNKRMLELQCERDDLLCAPNPLFNYTKRTYDPSTNQAFGDVRTTREFDFPPSGLVDDYIAELVSNGRLVRLNHT